MFYLTKKKKKIRMINILYMENKQNIMKLI